MKLVYIIFAIISTILSVKIINLLDIYSSLCDIETCPFCYGTNLCDSIKNGSFKLQFETLSQLFYNVFSVKNVYFATHKNRSVILKKLAHHHRLSQLKLTNSSCTFDAMRTTLTRSIDNDKHYQLCHNVTAEIFLKLFTKDFDLNNFCSIINVNIEPLILGFFPEFLPKFYGSCGRLIVVENCGLSLNHYRNHHWLDRAYIAKNLLLGIKKFTFNEGLFRLYLGDLSPDNVAINEDLNVKFIDVGGVILKEISKNEKNKIHRSRDFKDGSYGFSVTDICNADVSDHNFYSVCKLMLSNSSQWPMMAGGLLHDPPLEILKTHSNLFDNIELCVDSDTNIDRFDLLDRILDDLHAILCNTEKYGGKLKCKLK